MNAIDVDVLTALGQLESDTQVQKLLSAYALTERQDDPPLRHYLMSRSNGLSFLFEDGVLRDIQVFAQHTKSFAACPYAMPLGLRQGMTQAEVHEILGKPFSSDAFDSRYVLDLYGAQLFVEYDMNSAICYLSFEAVGPANL